MDELEKDSTRPYKRHILDDAFAPIPENLKQVAASRMTGAAVRASADEFTLRECFAALGIIGANRELGA